MARIVTITQPADTVRCGPDGRADYVFTIHNISGASLRVGAQVQVDEPGKEAWLKIQGPSEREIGENASEQLKVQAQIPLDTTPGKYKFHLLVYSVRRPGEDYTEGETVAIEVPAKEQPAPPPPPNPKFPWWIAAAVAVLLLGGLGVWWMMGEEPPEMVAVPKLENQRLATALQKIADANLNFGGLTEQVAEDKEQGVVLEQNPVANEEVVKGTEVFLTVSRKPGHSFTISNVELKALQETGTVKKLNIADKPEIKFFKLIPVEPEQP